MRLTKGKQIEAPVLVAGVPCEARYRVKIIDLLQQGEHFNIYKGEDVQGVHVCIKAIRYRSEKKDRFASAKDYILHRRATLIAEHRLLSVSHPCLPEPIAMLGIKNDNLEDNRLFRKLPEWNDLKNQEPILIQEYFNGIAISQLVDKLRVFSLERRLSIVRKIAKLSLYMAKQGYLMQNLSPSHILIQPKSDDNVYTVGLHNACTLTNGGGDPLHPGFGHFSMDCIPLEAYEQGHNYDQRINVFQLGMLLHFLLTLQDPNKEGNWWYKSSDFDIGKQKPRLQKAIRNLQSKDLWLAELVIQATQRSPEFRIPDISTFLHYLNHPPQDKVVFEIQAAAPESTELRIRSTPTWINRLKIRMEIMGKANVFRKEFSPQKKLRLPGLGIGTMVCSVSAVGNQSKYSWWQTCKTEIFPDIQLTPRIDLPPHKFGFHWQPITELHHISFHVIDSLNNTIELGDFCESDVELPPRNVAIPYHQSLKIEGQSYFSIPSGIVKGPTFSHTCLLFPPIPAPTYRQENNNSILEMVVAKKEAQHYTDIELLHNGWPREPLVKKATNIDGDRKKYSFILKREELDLFVSHKFNFRVLMNARWQSGEVIDKTITPPAVKDLYIDEQQHGWIVLQWSAIIHSQLQKYEVQCQQKAVARVQDGFYRMHLPLEVILSNEHHEVEIAVCAVYKKDEAELLSAPTAHKFTITNLQNIFQQAMQCQVTPFFVAMFFTLGDTDIQFTDSDVLFKRVDKQQQVETLAQLKLESEMTIRDEKVSVGEKYQYSLVLKKKDLQLLSHTVEIPPVDIQGILQNVSYESCRWEIQISPETSSCMAKDIEVVREGEETVSQFFSWPTGNKIYHFEDKTLMPGQGYNYSLSISFADQPPYHFLLGEVKTPKFQLQEKIEVTYNRAVITWTPSPAGRIDCVEINDETNRLIGSTRADSVTLENLEPERTYVFPVKYRYFGGLVVAGPILSFTTLHYQASVQAVDVGLDVFRLNWNITDLNLAAKINVFRLEVSGNVGTHKLGANTRSVQLRNLYPCTTYNWKLFADFKSGSSCALGEGETQTPSPDFSCTVEIGLVHHLQWNFSSCPAIAKVQLHRDDTPLLETSDKEAYDSDFKGGQEIIYKFFFIMRDRRRLFASEKKVQSLSLRNLFSALRIETGIGTIKWNFDKLKKFQYLKYIELLYENDAIYKQGSHSPSLTFEDQGAINEQGSYQGLSSDAKNFQLAVVGVAPTVRKYKKKWLLNIKRIQCEYPEMPYGFYTVAEHCCIYFEWDETETPFLQEIIISRAGDGTIIYQGANEAGVAYDDNRGTGLSPNRIYAYNIEMIYSNYQSNQLIEVPLERTFDNSRLEITTHIDNSWLTINWNKNIETSISRIGCRIPRWWLPKSLGQPQWAEFTTGGLSLTVPPSLTSKFQYQLVYEDYCGHTFHTPPQLVNDRQ